MAVVVWLHIYRYLQYSKSIFLYFFLVKGVVKCKRMILDIFGDTIYFELWFENPNLWVGWRNWIYFSILLLFFENGSFSNADGELDERRVTLFSELKTWGDSIFSLNLFFSIMISKSMSTFLPLARLYAFFSYFSRFISSILILLYSLFCSILLI